MESVARAFLFADLRDYTAFIERAGDQAAAELIREFREIVRERLERHEGAELKTEGDSFYLVFPAASRAIGFAVDVMRAATAPASGRPIRLGIGIHAGETVALEGQFVGSAVNLAARIGAAAAANEILVSDTVRGLVRTAIAYPLLDRGHVPLKGIAEPLRVYAVEWQERADAAAERAAVAAPTFASPELIGRAAELARLEDLAGALADGRGGTVTLGGAAGLGKTRLIREWASRTSGVTVLVGSCGATDSRPLYEPFAAMLRQRTRSSAEEQRLRRVSPELVALLPELQSGDRPRTLDRDTLFGSFLRLLRDHARTAPIAIVVEDMHWADESTLALFRFLAAEAEVTPYLLVATYRDDELHRGHALRPLIAELLRHPAATSIELHPLDGSASRQLLAHLRVDAPIGDAEREQIATLAEGNPLFLEELARSARGDGGSLPLSIAEAVLRRVAALDETAKRLVTYAAVSGQRAGFDLLERVLGMPERDVLRAARAAIDQSLLVESEDGIAFRHALTREAIYRDLMRREQRLLHREVAEALVALRGDDAAAAHEIERQFSEAAQPDRALPYALAAGDHALRLLAPAEAVAHFERAVDAAGAESTDRARGLEGLGNAYRLSLEVGKAAASLRDAVALYQRVGTSADVARVQIALASALPYGREEWQAWQAAWSRAEHESAPAQLYFIANRLAERAFQFMDDAEARHWTAVAQDLARRSGNESSMVAANRTALEIEHPAGWRKAEEHILSQQLDRALERDIAVLTAYRRFIDSRCREAAREEREKLLQRAREYAESRAPGVPRAMIFRFGQPWLSWLEGSWDRVDGLWRELQVRFSGDDIAEIVPDTGPIAAAIHVEIDGPTSAGAALRRAAERQSRTETWRGRLGAAVHLANAQLAEGRAGDVVNVLEPMLRQRGPDALDLPMALLVGRVTAPAALLVRDGGVLQPWLAAETSLREDGGLFEAVLDHVHATRLALAGDAAGADQRYARATERYRHLGWEHLAAELAWQRARAGNEADLPAAVAFYEARGARWRVSWLTEGGWR